MHMVYDSYYINTMTRQIHHKDEWPPYVMTQINDKPASHGFHPEWNINERVMRKLGLVH